MASPQIFRVDQAATFEAVAVLQVGPKTAFRSDEQLRADSGKGELKWEGEFNVAFMGFGGKRQFSIMKVGFVGPRNPGDGVPPYTPVQLVGLEVGVMDKTVTDKTTGEVRTVGAQVWYRAEGMQPAVPVASGGRGKAAEAA